MINTTCINATNGIRVCNDGSVMLCCMSKEFLTNSKNQKANIKIDSFDDILTGPKSTEIQTALKKGIRHKNCERCWNEEDGGISSKRIRDNKELSHVDSFDRSLKISELNLGTTCNLKCRICGPWASSTWNKDFFNAALWEGTEDEYKKWLHNLNHSYDEDSVFWTEIEKHISTLEKIDIYGGEPFMVKKQWELLKKSVNEGYSKNQKLSLNTNGTHLNQDQIDIMKNFKKVHIGISIDALENQFEYQRHPAKWENVLHNLLEYQKLGNDFDWEISVCVTLNMFNVFYLDSIFKFFQDSEIHYHLNILHDPPWYNVFNLPIEVKNYISEKYNSNDSLTELGQMWLKNAVDYINSKESNLNYWKMFIRNVETLDKIRSEDFKSTFVEYHKLLESMKVI